MKQPALLKRRKRRDAAPPADEAETLTILDASPIPSLIVDSEGVILAANAAFARLPRTESSPVEGRTLRSVVPPESGIADSSGLDVVLADAGPGGAPLGLAMFGEGLFQLWAARIAGGPNVLVTFLHGTNRREIERELGERDERLRIALEAGRMGTWRFDLATGEQVWSAGQYAIFGLEPDGRPPTRELFMALVHPEDHHLVEFNAEDIRREGTYLDSEFRIIRPDGTIRWVAAHALARFGEDGKPAQIIGVNQDVTDQKRWEEALRVSEERLRQFGESSSDVLWVRDAETLQWEYLSPAFDKTYGISRQDALRGDNFASWIELIVPDDREWAHAQIAKVRAGERATFEYRIRRPVDGEIRWLRNTDFPMRDADGRVVRIGGIGHDLTDLKAAEDHQRVLLAELQHRVRNTLTVIRSIARRTAKGRDSVAEYAEQLEGRIDAFARVQSAVTRNHSLAVELGGIVREEMHASAAPPELVTMHGPALWLQPKPAESVALAIHELATNAVKHGALRHPGGRVRVVWSVAAGASGDRLEFRWEETGLTGLARPSRRGFGMEILERSLTFDLAATTTLDYEPTGLVCTISIPIDNRLVQWGGDKGRENPG